MLNEDMAGPQRLTYNDDCAGTRVVSTGGAQLYER